MKTPLPMVMPRLASPFASIRQLSSITTLSPIRILCGWRSTTFWPKITFRPQLAEQRREQRLAQREPERAGHVLRHELDQLVAQQRAPARAARRRAPSTSRARLPAGEQLVLGARISSSDQRGFARTPRRVAGCVAIANCRLRTSGPAVRRLYDNAPDAPLDHPRDPPPGRPGPIRGLRPRARVLLRLRSGHRRPDGEAPRRAARLPGFSLRPDLHARRRGLAGGAAVRRVRRVGGRC